ncbi:YHYH domain-containing protein [Halomonas sp. DWK9]|uniref:YHYH domain-containing protein n=1 Tax=Halomonas sp. DWK9 TaxID=3060155 RepID=UPI00287F4DEE|nr:YHYH domain-containing protein [Halomonas sp. DWK9]
MKKVLVALMLAGALMAAGNVTAATSISSEDVAEHGGRTDSNGCHRDTKAGTRHCH